MGGNSDRMAPPAGVSVSEQVVENRHWRVQLNLASGGLHSLLWRSLSLELADPEATPHLFQVSGRDASGSTVPGRYRLSRARFDGRGASLAVEADLAGGVWRTVYAVEAGSPELRVEGGWLAPAAGAEPELAVALPPGGGGGWSAAGASSWIIPLRGLSLVLSAPGCVLCPDRPALVPPGAGLVLTLKRMPE